MTFDRTRFVAASFVAIAALSACASDANDEPEPATAGTAASMPNAGTNAGTNGAVDSGAPSQGVGGGSDAANPAGDEPEPTFDNEGQCYFEGSGVYENGAYNGTVAFVLFAEPFSDEELCRVQFDLHTVADADPACDFCYFSTVVEMSNPMVVTNVDDACGNSDRKLDATAIEAMAAAPPVALGFAQEATGHAEVLVEYDEALMRWDEVAFGSFDPDTGALSYDNNEGFCRY